MKIQSRITSLFLLCSAFFSQAQALTFDQALKTAQENSHEIKQLRMEKESSDWGKIKAISGYLPKLDLSGRHLFNERFEELEVPFGGDIFVMPAIQPYSSLGLSASLNLFNGFQTTYEMRAAEYHRAAAASNLNRAEEAKRTEIRSLFYKALGAQTLLNVANQTLETLESHLKDVNSRMRNGVSTRYDTLRVEVQLEEAQTEKAAAESSLVVARAKLFETLNQVDSGESLDGNMPDDFSHIDISKISLDSHARADRMALAAESDAALQLASASHSVWYPKLSVFGNYEWYNNINHSISESDNRFKSAYEVGVLFSWNLFDGGADLASQRQAALKSGIAKEKLDQLEQSMPAGLEEAKRRFAYDVLNYQAKLGSIRKAREAVRLARGGLQAGTLTNTAVLDAVADLNRAEAAAVRSQIDAIEALGQLELAVGHPLN